MYRLTAISLALGLATWWACTAGGPCPDTCGNHAPAETTAGPAAPASVEAKSKGTEMNEKIAKATPNQEELKKRLTPEQYHVTQEKGTERAFTGKFWNHHEDGTYSCVVCGEKLFTSESKFDSGCGWPSFSAPADNKMINEHEDRSHGMVRTEVTCGKCGAHLGHVFDDGPMPTRMRYCINSASLDFENKK